MSMGYGSNYADVIEKSEVDKICDEASAILLAELLADGMTFDELAKLTDIEDYAEIPDPILKAYETLQEQFEKFTGLSLGLGYHDVDESGDCYDDVDGGYFWVDGMYELTEAGKKYKNIVDRKCFVTFG